MGPNTVSSQIHVLLRTLEYDLIWKQGGCKVKMRSHWIKVGPQSNDWRPYKNRRGHMETHTHKDQTM